MQIDMPDFLDSPYYDSKTGKLKKNAPEEVVQEYTDYLKLINKSHNLYVLGRGYNNGMGKRYKAKLHPQRNRYR